MTKRCEYRDFGGTPPPPDEPPADPPADQTPPSEPSGLAANSANATSVSLTWNSSTDNVGVVGYDVYKNGAKMATVTSTSSIQGGLVCATSYWFGVEALDAAGNRSSRARVNATTSACSPPPSTGWTFCANEYERCTFTGTKEVRYGANGTFTAPLVFSNGVTCTNAIFGDPLPGANKRCEYRDLGRHASAAGRQSAARPGAAVPAYEPRRRERDEDERVPHLGRLDGQRRGHGIRRLRQRRNVLTANQPGATVPALACGTAFTFAVDALDTAGNRSTKAQVTASTAAWADTQAPTVPADVSASSRTATSIALTWSASTDNVGVTGYGLYRGGTLVGTRGNDDGDLLRPHLQHELHARRRRARTRPGTARARRRVMVVHDRLCGHHRRRPRPRASRRPT